VVLLALAQMDVLPLGPGAPRYCELAQACFEDAGDPLGAAFSLSRLGHSLRSPEACIPPLEAALSVFRRLKSREGLAEATQALGVMANRQGRYADAVTWLEESAGHFRAIDDLRGEALALKSLGDVAHQQGALDVAMGRYRACVSILRHTLDPVRLRDVIENMAIATLGLGNVDESARLFGAADRLRESIGVPYPHHRIDFLRATAAVSQKLGETGYCDLWSEGRRLTMQQILTHTWEGDSRR
jgi:tetratricopeptide (TPR) repeat protein